LFKGLGIGVWLRPRRAKNSAYQKIRTPENNVFGHGSAEGGIHFMDFLCALRDRL